jgi:uncharacterized membrane protein
MFRKAAANDNRRLRDKIRWRNHEVTRIEAFSDAVFAFALTLLIVSLEVPQSFDELLEGMKSFVPFAVCFALIFQIWMTQNIYFRRFSLHDTPTLVLNAALLFVVLFFVYPLKFLFNTIMLHPERLNKLWQVINLFYIYSGAYTTIFLLFALMYVNALRQRAHLQLTDSEVFETRTNVYRNLIIAAVGLVSVSMAALGGYWAVYAWTPYPCVGIFLSMLHSIRGKKHWKLYEHAQELEHEDAHVRP